MIENDYSIRNQTMFPQNITIQDCRDATKDFPGFRETVRSGIVCFNYDYCHKHTFPDPTQESDPRLAFLYKVRRECRGILFDEKTGKMLCRKFHKFFNIDEKEETQKDKVDINEPHILMEKLDGSLIAPIFYENKVQWGSKSGLTDLAVGIEHFISKNPVHRYNDFSEYWIKKDFTPMYEWCSEKNQIVLFYSNDLLSLTSCRNMITGEYLNYDEMLQSAKEYNVPIVNKVDVKSHSQFSTCKNVGEMLVEVHKMKNLEGFIIRFESGKIYKLKSEWYFSIAHSQINSMNLVFEKDIWLLVLNRQLDDYLAKVSAQGPVPKRFDAINNFGEDLFTKIDQTAIQVINTIIKLKVDGKIRKHIINDNSFDQSLKKFVFTNFDHVNETDTVESHLSKVSKLIVEHLKTLCHNSSKLEEARAILGNKIKFDEDYYLNLNKN